MRIFDLDSPLMRFLNRMTDILWLNILTMLCCIPVVTIGASLTAMHYMSLKMVRNEECYITRGFFKSFKENFRQATVIWMLFLLVAGILVGDFYIMHNAGTEFPKPFKIAVIVVFMLLLCCVTFVFPVLAKFSNTIKATLKNAFYMSILQFPKTVLMLIMGIVLPVVLFAFVPYAAPFVFLFGLALPAYLSAKLYDGFFQGFEDKITGTDKETEAVDDEEVIFKDEGRSVTDDGQV